MSATLTSRTIIDALSDEGILNEIVVLGGEEKKGDFPAPSVAERKRRPAHPGAILRDLYWPAGHSQSAVARHLGVSHRALSLLLNEQRPMTVDMARRLAHAFSTSPQFWLNLQHAVDVWDALHEPDAGPDAGSEAIAPLHARFKLAA